jgi:hypothetical protein
MMFAKAQFGLIAKCRIDFCEFAEPCRCGSARNCFSAIFCFKKRGKTARREREISFDQPLKFQERLFVKDDAIDGANVGLGLPK